MGVDAASAVNDPLSGVHGFFHSAGWHLFVDLTLAAAVAFWLASAYWVLRDARRRVDDGGLVAAGALLGLVPVAGPLLYLLVRPAEPLAERRARELEVRLLRQRMRGGDRCPTCGSESDPAFRFCPVCALQLKRPCAQCDSPLESFWQVCPFCGTPSEREQEGRPATHSSLVDVLQTTAAAAASDSS
jgi:Double zinc ribbon